MVASSARAIKASFIILLLNGVGYTPASPRWGSGASSYTLTAKRPDRGLPRRLPERETPTFRPEIALDPYPLCLVQQAAAPNVSPATTRTTPTPASDSACACPFLAWPLEIGCDPFATVVGKSKSERHLGRSSRYFSIRARRYAPIAPCCFTSAAARPRCCPNAPATARP